MAQQPRFYLSETMIVPEDKYMDMAILEAFKAKSEGDYAVGAVVIKDDRVLGAASHRSRRDNSPTAHAELLAIQQAARNIGSRHLIDADIYTTHEPCPMCAGAIVWAKMRAVVFGARISDLKNYGQQNGNAMFLWRAIDIPCHEVISRTSEDVQVVGDFRRADCMDLFHNK
jgi:tRNA(Arg) A34 adenosine deaminase TadA